MQGFLPQRNQLLFFTFFKFRFSKIEIRFPHSGIGADLGAAQGALASLRPRRRARRPASSAALQSRGWCKKPAGKMVATWTGGSGRLRQTGARAAAAGRPTCVRSGGKNLLGRLPAPEDLTQSSALPSDQLLFRIRMNFAMAKVGTFLSGLGRKTSWTRIVSANCTMPLESNERTIGRTRRRRRLRCGRGSVGRTYKARREWRESAATAGTSSGHAALTCGDTGTRKRAS